MKFTAPLVVALAASVSAVDLIPACKAQFNGKAVAAAIAAFCSKPGNNIVVPSTYAKNGKSSGKAMVQITGNCSPAQWVPEYWCTEQFYTMCASAKSLDGVITEKYGRNKCQTFVINNQVKL